MDIRDRAAAPFVLVAIVGAGGAAVVQLRALAAAPWAHIDTSDPVGWATTTAPDDVVAALLRVAALLACAWVTGSAVVGVLLRVARWRPAVAIADRLTPAVVRRLADRAVGATLVVLSVGPTVLPATAEPAPPAVVRPEGTGGPSPPGTAPPPRQAPVTPAGIGDTRSSVVAAPGDHLWRIATVALAGATGRDPAALSAAEIAPYWAEVVTRNRERLRSGDPDLLFPGEVVVLPDVAP